MFAEKSLSNTRRDLVSALREKGIDTPDIDARLLLMDAAGLSREELVARGNQIITSETALVLEAFFQRRISGEPIDSILGHAEFYGRRFEISKDVLSPRPETEGLVDLALRGLEGNPSPRVLDLGTGTGAILITLLLESKTAHGLGVDISQRALNVARRNSNDHLETLRAKWVQSDWYENVEGDFDMIVSNPPYITDEAMRALSPEVMNFDPDISLRGGADGLEAYVRILAGVGDYLKPGGDLIMEIGYDQGRSVPAMMAAAGFIDIAVHKDLSGHDRIVVGIWPANKRG